MTINFINGQQVTVTQSHNQFNEGDKFFVGKTDRINGHRYLVLKDADGNIKGSLPEEKVRLG